MIGISAKTAFSPLRITRPLSNVKRKFLFRAAFNVRRDARRSIRKGKGISAPGNPPKSHAGGLKNAILFAVDQVAEDAIIGAEARSTRTGRQGAGLQEHGGTVTVMVGRRRRILRYQPHPFMAPALAKVLPELPAIFSKSVS
jgi:hypothetical protein